MQQTEPKLESISLNLENCSVITIPAKAIQSLKLSRLKVLADIEIDQGQATSHTIYQSDYALLKVKKDDLEKLEASLDEMDAYSRLIQHPDIVDIYLNYSDGSYKNIEMNFKGEFDNELQHTYLDGDTVIIAVGENSIINYHLIFIKDRGSLKQLN